MRRLTIASIAACLMTGCTVHQANTPSVAGPSELATVATVTAAPDVVVMGPVSSVSGQSSIITAVLTGPSGEPLANHRVFFHNVTLTNCGIVEAPVNTNAEGKATTLFTAPGYPASGDCAGLVPGQAVTIEAFPDGTDFQGTVSSFANVQLLVVGPTP
jgi:hypothetical protein